ncbi:hypothetical protein DYB31_002645 [Aphanomyces astaci]|uniref:Uncharacterized protein n=1 Tax=Aphanomyces astaci TaxID=112090 RepID=A0A397FC63_APHAT|nr:hypothetical protein DYB31_002645 [Aphanomyces astaci]
MCSTTFSSCDEIQASAAYSCYSCTTSNDGSGTYQVLAGLSNSVTCSGSIVAAVTADVPLTVAPQYPTSIYGNVVAVSFASTVLLCFVAYVFRDRSKTSRKSASWLRLPLPWGQGLDFPLVGKFAIAIDAYWTKVLEDGVRQALVPYVVAETALLDLIWCFPRGKPHTSKWLTWGAFASDLLLKASIAIMFSSVNILAYDGCQVSVVNCHEGGTSVVTSSSSCFSNGIAVDSNDLQFSGTAYYLVPIVTRVLGYGIAAIRALLCDHHAKTFFVFAAVHGTAAVVAGTFVMKFQSSTSSATTDQRVKAIMSTLGMGYVGNLFEIPFGRDITNPSAQANLNMTEKKRMSTMNDVMEQLVKELEGNRQETLAAAAAVRPQVLDSPLMRGDERRYGLPKPKLSDVLGQVEEGPAPFLDAQRDNPRRQIAQKVKLVQLHRVEGAWLVRGLEEDKPRAKLEPPDEIPVVGR